MGGGMEMDYIYETIKFNKTLPVNIFVHSVNHVQNHWHESLELLFILSGGINVAVEGEKYELKAEDIILVNYNEIHALDSKCDNVVLALQIPVEVIKLHYEDFNDIKFICKSFLYKSHEQGRFDELRNILAEMMWFYSKGEDGFELKLLSLLFNLIYILVKDFRSMNSDNKKLKNSEKYLDRLSGIVSYIKENFKSEISLNALAQKEYLSAAYLSKFFQKYMGMTFSNYVSNVRLEYAVKDLIYTDLSITQIALRNGFANEKSLFNAFKETYGDTPNHYRKKINNNLKSFDKDSGNQRNYFEVDTQSVYRALYKYLIMNNYEQDYKHDLKNLR
jgi:xylan 1,4-beta-xylosidase